MKKTTKIVSLVLACIFCFAALSVGLLAADTCPNHPHQGLYTIARRSGNAYYHEYYCSVCNIMFGVDDCNFTVTYDCTVRSHCILCDQYNYAVEVFSAHSYPSEWRYITQYHYKSCQRSGCLQELTEKHNLITRTLGGVTYTLCTVCDYSKS